MMKNLLTVALFILTGSLYSQNIVTDRPDQTESPIAVKKGELQIESGLLFERNYLGNGVSEHRSVYPTNLFRIGLVKNLELRIVNEIVTYEIRSNNPAISEYSVSGTENLQIGFKYQFTDSESKLVVGAVAHAVVPSGSNGISNNKYGIFSRINFSYDLSENKNLGANIGYNNYDLRFDEEGLVRDQDGNFIYTLVYVVGISDRVGMYVEAFGDYVNMDIWQNNMNAGMTYLLKENIQLDYSYGWGLDRDMNFHSVGISIRLPK